MDKKGKRLFNRRNFLKTLGLSTAAGTISFMGCKSGNSGEFVNELPSISEGEDGKMTYRTMPGTDEKVSILGYGMMRLPLVEHDKDENEGAEPIHEIDQEMVNQLVDYALEHGVNYFDTSPRYCKGKSETATGIALSRHPRNSYVVATKLSNFDASAQSREASMEMYRNSFKALQVDYIDYYLLHSIGNYENFKARYLDNGMLDFLVEERKAGRIRYLGWSFHGTKEFFDYMMSLEDNKEYHFDFVQIQMNYLDWKHSSEVNAEYMYNELTKRGIPSVIMEPLRGGGLSNLNNQVLAMMQRMEPTKSPASWAFRFAGQYPGVLTVLSGMTLMDHLVDNVRTYSPLVPLSEEELKMLQDSAVIINDYPLIGCTNCQYCMPCPFGLDIPGIFAHYNKCLNEGLFATSTTDPEYARQRRAFLIGYDRAVSKLRQADHCTTCGICQPKCPQKIRIPREMVKIDHYVENLRQQKDDVEPETK